MGNMEVPFTSAALALERCPSSHEAAYRGHTLSCFMAAPLQLWGMYKWACLLGGPSLVPLIP